jgi:cobalamin biosynthesis Mg chelatase CobN
MAKVNRPGSQKTGSNNAQANEKQQVQPVNQPSATGATSQKKGKTTAKSHRPTIGGTAATGAKSTQPKETGVGSPSQQQPEYYNREARRRMEQMGTGPYAQRATVDPRERRKKRKERLQERQERMAHLVNAKGPSRDIKLGRRNTYFVLGTIAVLIILIVVFIIIRHPF